MNDKLVIRLLDGELSSASELDWDLYDAVGRSVASDTSPLETLAQIITGHSENYTVT